jgi:thioredoxin 1
LSPFGGTIDLPDGVFYHPASRPGARGAAAGTGRKETPMAGANTLHFDDANFETEVLKSSTPVLVDFWAEWCTPCVALAPTIDELANDYQGKVKVGKVDVDKAPKVAAQFGILNIPTVIIFKTGQPVERIVGGKRKSDYKTLIDSKITV